ncbi:MAG: tRNA lysidine(34) synthetase TilS [Candidatus Shikimatogenerans bostrichidophilus]|nr:MAG: tRNA lysidine(34) synthetase TilS [Candidatus Shikimatogenerans bostrichidophilus]
MFKLIKKKLKKLKNKKFLLAISGGVDSMVLLHIFNNIFKKKKINVANCNFTLYKNNNNKKFIYKECKKKKNIFFYKKFNTKIYSKKKKISIQMAARKLRYNWFLKLKKKFNINYIVLGHHLDDKIETFFINLFRSSGIYGLKSINYIYKKIYLRPLIFYKKKYIIKYALKKKIKWKEDLSNYKNYYLRNKIRNIIIPTINSNIINFKKKITKSLNNIYLEYKFIKIIINFFSFKIKKKKYNNPFLLILNIKNIFNIKYFYFILYKILYKYGFKNINIIKKFLKIKTGKYFLSKKYKLIKYKNLGLLTIIKKKKINIIINNIGKYKIINNLKINFVFKKKIKIKKKKYIYLNFNKIKFPLYIRNWIKGDYYYNNKKKKILINKIFKKKKLSLFDKDNIYLLFNNNYEFISTINIILIKNKKFLIKKNNKIIYFKFLNYFI